MKGESKLSVKHFYNEDVLKIGRSITGFPIQAQVRYKGILTTFSSRFGLRYEKSNENGNQIIRTCPDVADKIINQENEYIYQVKNYLENELELPFNPQILVNEDIEVLFLKSVIEYFNMQFLKYDLLTVLRPILGNSADQIVVKINLNIVDLLLFIKSLNQDVYNKIIEKRNYKMIVSFYEELEKLNRNIRITEMDLISFRLLEVNKDSDLGRFKETFGKWFDTKIIDLLKSDKNYSSFFSKW